MGAITAQQESDRNAARDAIKEKAQSLFPMPSLKDTEGIDQVTEDQIKATWEINPMRKILSYELKKEIHVKTTNLIHAKIEEIPAIKAQIEGMNRALVIINRVYKK